MAALISACAEPFGDIETAELGALLERIGDARLVLIGEASHGTSEFYRLRARLTQELIERLGFQLVAIEADWPDAAVVDRYVRARNGARFEPFARFPSWMWRNHEVLSFIEWLARHNASHPADERVGFHGLDLYSLATSVAEVLRYLDEVDPETAAVARQRYGCLTPFQHDPAAYGYAALTERYSSCEEEVVAMLLELRLWRTDEVATDAERLFDAQQNARLAANAERYYREMYHAGPGSWNLRDEHMFETLEALREARGDDAKAVVWAHNSHLGDATATEMYQRGEINLGHLVRRAHGGDAYLMGFGTDRGTVAAAADWGAPFQVMRVRPAHPDSYEKLCHEAAEPRFLLHLRQPARAELTDSLLQPRLERAIGVVYRPQSELASHYFEARLPDQFD
ncbi:MAG: erythromycin esterase family protein, partial [Chloroflexota bacterium]|nr:erythromycin esterase family protein [Chloroflexota bacterium]